MIVDELIIEVTRRCNMTCAHCLRGGAQRVDFDVAKFRTFLVNNKVDSIYNIVFSGGEPSLRPEIIRGCLDILKELNISLTSFYIATNGKKASDEFIRVLIDLYLYSDDPEYVSVRVSKDDYHDTPDDLKKLKALRFVELDGFRRNVISEGRGKNISGAHWYRDIRMPSINEYGDVEGLLYFNALGEIISDCDLSYVNQKKHKLCNYDDLITNVLMKTALAA